MMDDRDLLIPRWVPSPWWKFWRRGHWEDPVEYAKWRLAKMAAARAEGAKR